MAKGLPLQAEANTRRGGPLRKLIVDSLNPAIGTAHEPLNLGRDFRLKMVFQNFALFGREQLAASAQLAG